MKNKVFFIFFSAFLVTIVIFFLLLIASLFVQLSDTGMQKQLEVAELLFAIKLTLVTATVSSVIALLFSLPIAYLLSRCSFPGKKLVNSLLLLPIVVSPIALGAMLLIFFNTGIGRFIEDHMSSVVFEFPALILAQFVVVIGLSITLLKAVFDYLSPDYEDMAQTLGASRFHVFIHNVLPLARPGISAAFLLTWARAAGEFGASVMLAGTTPMKTETLPVAVFLAFSAADLYNAIVLVLVSIVMSMFLLYLIQVFYVTDRKS